MTYVAEWKAHGTTYQVESDTAENAALKARARAESPYWPTIVVYKGKESGMDNLEKRLLLAYGEAIASKGKNKGMLKAKCPPMGTDAAIMWQACMMHANPWKVSIFQTVMAGHGDESFYGACMEFADARRDVLTILDRDRVALERLGVW